MNRLARALSSGVISIALTACSPATQEPSESETAASPPAKTGAADASPVVAEVGGTPLTANELDAWIKEQLFEENVSGQDAQAQFETRSQYVDQWITERVLTAEAESRGVSIEELLTQQAQTIPPVDDQAIQTFFEQNQHRMPPNSDLDELRPAIEQYLTQQAASEAQGSFVRSLRDSANAVVNLERPRVEVAANGPSMGPDDAPITIIEFSDYQCPFCRSAEDTVKEVLKRYPGKIRFVYRHFPLESIHPRARPAAEAAACADEQGKFWAYHEALFSNNAFEDADLLRLAEETELDVDGFKACTGERRFASVVTSDLEEAQSVGVNGTPAFFVNGLMLSGAVPIDEFVRLIDDELSRLGSS